MEIEVQRPVASPSDSEKIPWTEHASVEGSSSGMVTAGSVTIPIVAATQTAKSFGERSNHNGVRSKISRVAPSGRLPVERTDVGDVNKSNDDNEILHKRLHESNGEMQDFDLQSLRSDNSHEAGPDIGRSSGSPADEVKGRTNVSSTTPEIIAVKEKFHEDCISVVRDTTPGSGLVQQGAASNKAEDLSYSGGKGHILTEPEVSA